MNKALKKAISFLAAAAVSVTALISGTVTAFAASDVSANQVLNNRYDMYVAFKCGALYAAKATTQAENDRGELEPTVALSEKTSYVMLTDNGKRLNIKNAIGFDKIYSVASGNAQAESISQVQSYSMSECIIVGRDDKYAAILSDGSFLENGLYFDMIYYKNGFITAIIDNAAYVYDMSGEKLGTIPTDAGCCSDYDSASGSFLTAQFLIRNGETVKEFEEPAAYYFTEVNGATYVCMQVWFNKTYYTLDGDQTEVSVPSTDIKRNLTVNIDENDSFTKSIVTVTDASGRQIVSFEAPAREGKGGGNEYTFNNGKLIIAWGDFCIIDDAAGTIEAHNSDKFFSGISSYNSLNKTFAVKAGTKQDSEFGDYYSYKVELYDSKGNCLSEDFDGLTPTVVDGYPDYIRTYPKDTSFIASKEGKLGLVNCWGKTILKPTFDSAYSYNKATTIMQSNNSPKFYILSNKTGKLLLSVNRKIRTDYDFPYLQPLNPDTSYFITSNAEGTRFGCVVIRG